MEYKPDYAATRRYLQVDRNVRSMLHKRAMLGLAAAVPLAPKRTGELAASGEVKDNGPGVDRMSFSIIFTSRHAVPATFPQHRHQPREYLEAALSIMARMR